MKKFILIGLFINHSIFAQDLSSLNLTELTRFYKNIQEELIVSSQNLAKEKALKKEEVHKEDIRKIVNDFLNKNKKSI